MHFSSFNIPLHNLQIEVYFVPAGMIGVVVDGAGVCAFGVEGSAVGASAEAPGAGEGRAAGELAGPLATAAIKIVQFTFIVMLSFISSRNVLQHLECRLFKFDEGLPLHWLRGGVCKLQVRGRARARV